MRSDGISGARDRGRHGRRPHDNGRPLAWSRFDLEIGADESGAFVHSDETKSFIGQESTMAANRAVSSLPGASISGTEDSLDSISKR
jgi:hypothetical protein